MNLLPIFNDKKIEKQNTAIMIRKKHINYV